MIQDIRFAFRLFRSHTAASVVAVLTLALGIGAATTVFGLLDALFLKTHIPAGDTLVRLQLETREGGTESAFSYPLYSDLRDQVQGFSASAGYVEVPVTVRAGSYADRVFIECVTSDYFRLLGAAPQLGSAFSLAQERAREPVAILSHDLWQRAAGGDGGAVGRRLLLNGRPFTIVGVAPEGFTGIRRGSAPQVWIPAPWLLTFVGVPAGAENRGISFLGVIARLSPDRGAPAAAQEATAVAARTEPQFGDKRIVAITAARGDDGRVEEFQGTGRLVAAAVTLLLLIACANVMHMLLAWGEGRRREIALRLALGASRRRVLRQFLIESGVLAMLGAVIGTLAAAWGLALLSRAPAFGVTGVHVTARADWRVLAGSAAIALCAALIAGALPAFRAARQTVRESMRRATGTQGRWRPGAALAVMQIALSLVLLVAAGVFTRSVWRLRGADTNMDVGRVLVLQAQFGMDTAADRLTSATERIIEALETLPGVESVAAATTLPVSQSGMLQRFDPHTTVPAVGTAVNAQLQFVSPRFFATVGLPLIAGQPFGAADEAANPIVVNESFARRYWPEGGAVGRTFVQKSNSGDEAFRVIAVARDTKYRDLREDGTLITYRPLSGFPTRTLALLVRTLQPPGAVTDAVRERLYRAEPGLTVWNIRSLDEHINKSLAVERARRTALALFALFALVLVALGVYGIMTYTVSRRFREIGIRVALGATPRTLSAMVLRRTSVIAGLGILTGAGVVYAGGHLVASQLYGIVPADPATLSVSAVSMLVLALGAAYVPARRAATVDPMVVLPLE